MVKVEETELFLFDKRKIGGKSFPIKDFLKSKGGIWSRDKNVWIFDGISDEECLDIFNEAKMKLKDKKLEKKLKKKNPIKLIKKKTANKSNSWITNDHRMR